MQKSNKAPKSASKSVHKHAATSAGAAKSHRPAAQPAKKAAPVKKKSQPIVVTKKVNAKPGAKPAAHAAAKGGPGKKEAPKKSHPAHEKTGKGHGAEKAHDRHHTAKPSAAPTKVETHAAAGKRKLATHAPVKTAAAKAVAPAAPVKPAKESSKPAPTALAPQAKETDAAKALKAKKAPELERVVETSPADEEVILTDAEGRRYCRMKDCDQAATVDGGYCRYHYLLFWKNIQSRKKILSEGKLERYIEELTARYPDKYLELLRKDLRSEKDFLAAIQELEIDDSGVDNEFEDEAQSYLDEVRGVTGESNSEREEDF